MSLKESEMFRDWFINRTYTEELSFYPSKILADEGILIDYNSGKRNEYKIIDLDIYNLYYKEVIIPLIREQKLKDLGI